MFTNDSEIIPTKADLLNMDLMSDKSMFTNEAEVPSVNVSKCQSEKVVDEDVPINRSENICQTTRSPANEALAHTAIIELIKEAVKCAMLPLKEEISFLRATIMKQNEKVLPQVGQENLPAATAECSNSFPQQGRVRFPNTDVRESLLNPLYLASPSYTAMANSWGLSNQGRGKKLYSQTLSGREIDSIINPTVQIPPL